MNATFQSSSHGRLHVHTLQTKKYKTATLWLVLERPLAADDVTEVALLPRLLLRGTDRHRSPETLMQAFDEQYGAGISGVVGKHGDVQTVEFHVQFADETYLPGHPDVLEKVVQLLADVFLRPAWKVIAFNVQGLKLKKTCTDSASKISSTIKLHMQAIAQSHLCVKTSRLVFRAWAMRIV
ncbi:hypothetical protein ATW55_05270 [Ferroacidibacillus organovorans]|uniref:Peptidase M16 N-terminal domain-containing protein n=1 Tax=Ferroacidibacillus organovorans TaxID=1765683 RepID=A0A101XQL8_9BACL|nr:hypothetical protein [Ferroacidibacillus organovorans]KUO95744.1 hypothetical protein ATW55_05270 [Ferroacidibacillus organovorans]